MKIVKRLLLVLLLSIMVLPLTIKAENNKVNVYIFRGEGCPHCEEALTWFDGLDEKTKSKFDLIQYEVWNNKENANLMKKVAKALDKDSSGVPLIIIGDKSFVGFAESYESEILNKIEEEYNQEEKFDIMENIDETITKDNDAKAIKVIIAFIVLAAGILIYYISKSN